MQVSVSAFHSFAEILQSRAAGQSGERAFVFLDRQGNIAGERTYAQLDAKARVIASELTARGLAGEPVLLVFPSGLEFIEALFGCFYAGCIAVPVPYLMAKRAGERIGAICRDCLPAAALTLSRMENDAEVHSAMLRYSIDLTLIYSDILDAAPSAWLPRSKRSDDLALLQYTSGSTSDPKGVMLSHGNLIANSAMIRDAFGHDATSRGVSWLPLFHDMGLIGHVLQPVYVGALSVLMSPLSFLQRPSNWLKAISDWRATTSGGPNHAFELCTRLMRMERAKTFDLSSWRVAYCGAEMVRADVLERFAAKFASCGFRQDALYPCYGLAEATLMVSGPAPGRGMRTVAKSSRDLSKGGAVLAQRPVVGCGWSWHDESIQIVDPVSSMPVADGKVGEIWVKGSNVGRGYWRRPKETEATFGSRISSGEADYLRTGDLGFVEGGELFIEGRIKDTIIVRGINHAPEDLEATIAASHPAFAASAGAVFRVEVVGEEEVVAVQEITRSVKDEDGLNAAVAAAFAYVTRERGLRLYDFVLVRAGTIPRTSSGKVRRGRCREIYKANEFERLNAASDLRPLRVNAALGVD